MAFHLIGSPGSTCTQRILTVLAEKGVTDFTIYQPDFMNGEHKKPEHTAKQPFGQIPVLEEGDFRLYESRAISRYLAAKYADKGTKLLPEPTDLKAVAKLEQWFSVELDNYDHFAHDIVEQKLFNVMKGLGTVPEVVDYYTAKFQQKLDIFEGILAKQKYMGGDEFSLVDIFYLPYTQKLFQVGDGALITSRPNVNAWWEKVSTRDSWKKVLSSSK